MRYAQGKEGSVSLPGSVSVKLTAFNVSFVQDEHEVSGFGDGGNRCYVAGLHRWGGSCRGFPSGEGTTLTAWETLMTGTVGGTGTAYFNHGGGVDFSGAIQFSGVRPSQSHRGGVAEIVITFVGINEPD